MHTEYRIETIETLTTALEQELLALWEASVRATHTFLTREDIRRIRTQLPQALRQVELVGLWMEEELAAFAGCSGDKLEMLFVAPRHRGRGAGGRLVRHVQERHRVRRVDVNEQNDQAVGFYNHLGFRVTGRSPVDGQGEPFPLLHLELGE